MPEIGSRLIAWLFFYGLEEKPDSISEQQAFK